MRTFFLGLIGLFFGAALLSSPDASGVGGGLLGGAVGIAFSLLIERGRSQKKLLRQVAALHEQQKSQAEELARLRRRVAETEAAPPPQPIPAAGEPVSDVVAAPIPVEPTPSPPPVLAQSSAPLPAGEPVAALEPAAPPIAAATPPPEPPRPRPAAPPRTPSPPAPPTPLDLALAAFRRWLVGGNTPARIGILLLFLGLAFALRLAAQYVTVPIELRYAGVALVGLVLQGIGWRLRERQRIFALLLQGGGVAVLYLTIFAAMRLHPLISPDLGFPLLVLVVVFAAILAVAQDSLALAAASTLGGFAAPMLVASADDRHVLLFSYFALLNAGILAIAWFKAWRLLNVIGFAGTFVIGLA
jgi:uncharacterized membrane protein